VVALAVVAFVWRLLFFLSVGGWGEQEGGGADHTLVPATPEPTPRAYRYVEHVR
jgi:hypothetical protein